jgi:undecaprenyl-diphosphatase
VMWEAVDLAILQALYAGAAPTPVLEALLFLTFLGSGWMLLGLLPALFLAKWRREALAILAALTLLSAVVAGTKALTCRVRPCHAVPWARALRFAVPSDHSFPSGHAAGSFAFAFFVLAFHRRAGVWLVALASAVAWSRVALGVHYPSDVVAGAILGSWFGWLTARLYRPRAPRSLSAVGAGADAEAEPARQ